MEGQPQQIFVIENPLLDISIELKDNEILKKYELAEGQASLAGEKQMPIYDEIWGMPGREAIPGGSALNTARSANWMLKHHNVPGVVTYYGSIGEDEKGQVLAKDCSDNGINANFHKAAEPTGTCAVVVVDKDRTLCANLAAACKYSTEHLDKNFDVLKNAKFIYTTSFFITSNVEALMKVAKYATENDIPMGFNLSAVFLLQFELANVVAALEHADYLFANEDEAAEFGKTQGMEGADLKDIAKAMAKFKKANTKRPRIAVVTNGAKPVIVAQNMPGEEDVQITEYEIAALTKEQIVDTNGAGDAFVGGFLSQLYQEKDLAQCIKAGIYLSREVVQRSGCTFPDKFEF